jgi:cell division protein FtsB
MDWTGAFAVIGAVVMILSAAVTAAVVGVLAWIGAKHVWSVYQDEEHDRAELKRQNNAFKRIVE